MSKGRIIAGVGIIIGTIITAAHYLRRGPVCTPGDTECRGNDLYICDAQGQWKLEEENSPSCIVQPTTGLLQGYVVNTATGAKIPRGNALITIDGTQTIYNTADSFGGFRTPALQYGVHHFTVEVDDYVTGEFDLEISEPVTNFSFELDPLPAAPTPWTEGVTVEKVRVDKPVAYAGEVVHILIDIQYAYPAPLPADISGTVLVDGQELTEMWTIDFRNPTLSLAYTTSQVGIFTVRAQTKSTTFEVVQQVPGTYYPPHGGVRFPTCTELTVPDVAVLTSGRGVYGQEKPGWGNVFVRISDPTVIAGLSDAYPSAWSPFEASVRQSGMLITQTPYGHIPNAPTGKFVFTMPTDYTCPPYWASKEELANVIASSHPSTLGTFYNWFTELKGWLAQFGPKIIPFTGWKDWVKEVGWGHDNVKEGYVITLGCPYCPEVFRGTLTIRQSEDRLPLARKLLEHIDQNHPDHPLTAPAWF